MIEPKPTEVPAGKDPDRLPAEGAPSPGAPARQLLLVEGSPADADLVREALGGDPACTWHVRHVTRLADAIGALAAARADVVLLDLSLPDSSGLAGVEQLVAERPEVPVVVLSGEDDAEMGTRAVRQGAQEHLVKGELEARTLGRVLRHAVERHALALRAQLLAREQAARAAAEEAHREVAEALRLRDDFISVAGHELKTPLMTVLLDARRLLAAEDLEPGARRRALERIARGGERLAQLMDDLLDVSRIRAGRFPMDVSRVELRTLVTEVADRYASELSWAGSALQTSDGAPVFGRWDRSRLQQVVANLLQNAIRYGAGRPIEVWVEEEDGVARVRVRDHGLGIGHEEQAHLFDAFWRPAGSRKEGLGLGLWITKRIVEAHSGSISVMSEPGEGAEFLVELPCAGPPPASGGE
jgi:sigma-B regulation protein RsbU (phosphoserine phosphatase)